MLAVYTEKPDFDAPLSALKVGERPPPIIPEGWLRVRVEAASLNRHDLWTLRGITQHPPLPLPMILGCDGAGVLDDGSPVVIFPGMGDPEWRGEMTLDPQFHVFSELCNGTMADYVAVPRACALPRPDGMSAIEAAALGTAWLTAYKMLFVRSGLRPGQRMLVQGASGGVSTALIQLGHASGMEVWATSRNESARARAIALGAHEAFETNSGLPSEADAVFETVGEATWEHSLRWVRCGGTVVLAGRTSGGNPPANLRQIFVRQITVHGSVLGGIEEMRNLLQFVRHTGIQPAVGHVWRMERARDAFEAMWEGRTSGKTVLTTAAA